LDKFNKEHYILSFRGQKYFSAFDVHFQCLILFCLKCDRKRAKPWEVKKVNCLKVDFVACQKKKRERERERDLTYEMYFHAKFEIAASDLNFDLALGGLKLLRFWTLSIVRNTRS
jgi:hypothetical protein